ncbi:MAG: peptide chain release factor 2 [Candidatus Coatesbacteria bacterium]|nr:peptide chain release factor 2 [Candidatus Coatesbacteria bacterium]
MRLESHDIEHQLKDLSERIETIRGIFDLGTAEEKIKELDNRLESEELWSDPAATQKLMKQRAEFARRLEEFSALRSRFEDASVMAELAASEDDVSALRESMEEIRALEALIADMETRALLSGESDERDAIIQIQPGAGGTEAQDWAEMLMRMYTRWAETRGYSHRILDRLPGDEAGIKSVTIQVTGPNAYGYLKGETGVHRLVRISPFDANRRRHTSFAAVSVTPEVDDSIEINVDEKDLRIDTYRSSGKGGQHVNTTDSAVRITHIPTGVVVQCQNERSQHRNREVAMKILKSHLYQMVLDKRRQDEQNEHSAKKEIAWGSQIRSYVMQPYQMVKDHRTNLDVGNVDSVMDGYIDPFIRAYLVEEARR